ncbi:glucose dehydrogenase [FAD, quinone]-like [Trichogramma pretiosum]|uniref:glucose dehydrogenase [FAD, quinone]-like n=1 Tax=Trichogramma pretiosum TaxID=7493 RepID=UPI0006C97E40|nr:glucose dehydrogenase [FAD, quinone]-like [Trichogramma pretiosum]
MFLLKFIFYSIYSLGVVIFSYYVSLSYLYTSHKDWFYNDIKNNSVYDYIIVGAGSAGSTLATRLSNAGANTLLIEAGGSDVPFFNIPIIAPMLINTPYDWQYLTVPQEKACKALINNQSAWSAGKILGGSSRLNYMIHSEGHPDDYKSWFPDFEEMLMKSSELLQVDKPKWKSIVSDAILKGLEELTLKNINSKMNTKFKRVQLTMKNGERWSVDRAMKQKSNNKLTVITNSFVTKILFNLNTAYGVNYIRHDETLKAFAEKGVILSAGTIGSSKLLLLSGIGPKDHLEEMKIKNIVNLPVGQNLKDHIITGFDLINLDNNIGMSIADALNPSSMFDYFKSGQGPWTLAGVEIIGTFHSKLNNLSTPDLQFMIFPVGLSQDNGVLLRKNIRISKEVFDEYFAPLSYGSSITIAPVLLHPKSSGEIKLKSNNPFDLPIVDPKYLSHEEDALTLIEGIQIIKEIIKTESMQKVGAKLYEKHFPGCEMIKFDTKEYWECYLQYLSLTTYHPVGTCKIGEVVDFKFRVKGTQNLYVVDASIFPELPSGNTHIPVVVAAEKAAMLIIESFKKHKNSLNKCFKKNIFQNTEF